MSNNFELAPSKMTVRMDLMQQAVELALHLRKKKTLQDNTLYLCTLPGENWTFETMLWHRLNGIGIDTKFMCAEYKQDVIDKALGKMPDNGIDMYVKGTIEHLLDDNGADIGWADYCGFATTHRIKSVVQNIPGNLHLIYATFYTNPRKYAKNPQIQLENSKSKNLKEAIVEEFEYWLRYFKIKSKVKLVYHNEYSNGQGNPMMTIGFARKTVPVSPIIRKPKPKVNKSEHTDKATQTWDKIAAAEYGVDKTIATKEQRTAINALVAKELGLSRQKVGSIMAHYLNPESWGKAA